MTAAEARALLMVAALLSGASGSAGFVGGRISAPVPPAEVRIVTVPAPVDAAPTEPKLPAVAAPAEAKPPPKVEAKPKPQAKPQPKPEKAVARKPRAVVNRQRKPTTSECAQMHQYGRSVVKAGGRLRGYSDHQIERALRDCGL